MIIVGMRADEGLRETFDEITPVARLSSPYAMPYEIRHPILVCRKPKIPLAEAWRRGRQFI